MPIFGSFRMASSKACAIDAAAGARSFFLRGDGVTNAAPTADDLGNVLTPSASGRTKFSNAYKYWADYSTSLWLNQSGLTTPGAPFNLGGGSAPFTILWRGRFNAGPGGEVAQSIAVTGNGFGGWGPGGLQSELRVINSNAIRWNFYGGSNPTVFDFAAPSSFMDGLHEWAICFDGAETHGYIDGVKRNSAATDYTPINQALTTRLFASDDASYCNTFLNDFTVYSGVCLTTASSYTLPTLPPC